jgi:predicted alpha-1,2-mannosidase
MLDDYAQDGMLPKWSNANGESYEMVGDPADPIIAGAYAFGARDFDADAALQAVIAEATRPSTIRPGQDELDRDGYLPNDLKYGCCNFTAAVSTQLEYDTADYAVAAFAKALHHEDVYSTFASQAQNWQNAFNPATGYVQAKLADGRWVSGFTPGTSTGMIEGSAAEYTPMVPFNVSALVGARGGDQAWESYLDGLTANLVTPGPENAKLSNEPSLAIPWEYDYVGAPWKTQQVVRQAQVELFGNAPAGEPGNDDLGAMGSWYVWSALGLYPLIPGSDTLVLGSPAFPRAVLHLAGDRSITVNAPSAAVDSPYVQGFRLNGEPWPKLYLTASQYAQGAQLDVDLGSSPGTWGSGPSSEPPSDATGESAAIPFLPAASVNVASGQSALAELSARNVTDHPVTVDVAATPPAGITVTPAAALTIPGGDTAGTGLSVAVGADTAPGSYRVPITLRARPHGPPRTVTLTVTVTAS